MRREAAGEAREITPEHGHESCMRLRGSEEGAALRKARPTGVFRHLNDRAGALLAAFHAATRDPCTVAQGVWERVRSVGRGMRVERIPHTCSAPAGGVTAGAGLP